MEIGCFWNDLAHVSIENKWIGLKIERIIFIVKFSFNIKYSHLCTIGEYFILWLNLRMKVIYMIITSISNKSSENDQDFTFSNWPRNKMKTELKNTWGTVHTQHNSVIHSMNVIRIDRFSFLFQIDEKYATNSLSFLFEPLASFVYLSHCQILIDSFIYNFRMVRWFSIFLRLK